MRIKLIKTSEDYNNSVALLQALGESQNFGEDEEQINDFELLSELIHLYEQEHFPIKKSDPIELIKMKMDYMGIKRKDITYIASSGVLSDLFKKKRGLSKKMIREFSDLLGLSQDLLNPLPGISIEKNESSLQMNIKKDRGSEVPIFSYVGNELERIKVFKKRTSQTAFFNIGQCY